MRLTRVACYACLNIAVAVTQQLRRYSASENVCTAFCRKRVMNDSVLAYSKGVKSGTHGPWTRVVWTDCFCVRPTNDQKFRRSSGGSHQSHVCGLHCRRRVL